MEIQDLQVGSSSLKKILCDFFFIIFFSPCPDRARKWGRSGTIWHSSFLLSTFSHLGRPCAPSRTEGSLWPPESGCGFLYGHTSAGFQNNLEIMVCLWRCRTSCRAPGTVFYYFLWELMGWLPLCGPSLLQAAYKGGRWRERCGAMGLAWNPPVDIAWMWLSRQERADIGLSLISAAPFVLRHTCALLCQRETGKLGPRWFYNLHFCFSSGVCSLQS